MIKYFLLIIIGIKILTFSCNDVSASTDLGWVRSNLITLETALQMYYLDLKRYPTTIEGLKSLIININNSNEWNGPYCKSDRVLKDLWGNEFVYKYPAEYGDQIFDLYSIGINIHDDFGDKDDVTNWKGVNYEYYGGTTGKTRILLYTIGFLLFISISFPIIKLFANSYSKIALVFALLGTTTLISALFPVISTTGEPVFSIKVVLGQIVFFLCFGFSSVGIVYSILSKMESGFDKKNVIALILNSLPWFLILSVVVIIFFNS